MVMGSPGWDFPSDMNTLLHSCVGLMGKMNLVILNLINVSVNLKFRDMKFSRIWDTGNSHVQVTTAECGNMACRKMLRIRGNSRIFPARENLLFYSCLGVKSG